MGETWAMASKGIPVLCFCLIILSVLGCATRPVSVEPNDPLFGTWVNDRDDRLGSSWFAKKVILPDGRELDFNYVADTEPSFEGHNSIEKAWIDAEGNHWYRIHYTNPELNLDRFVLSRVNAQGTLLEQINGRYAYPDDLDATDVQYVAYQKKQ